MFFCFPVLIDDIWIKTEKDLHWSLTDVCIVSVKGNFSRTWTPPSFYHLSVLSSRWLRSSPESNLQPGLQTQTSEQCTVMFGRTAHRSVKSTEIPDVSSVLHGPSSVWWVDWTVTSELLDSQGLTTSFPKANPAGSGFRKTCSILTPLWVLLSHWRNPVEVC